LGRDRANPVIAPEHEADIAAAIAEAAASGRHLRIAGGGTQTGLEGAPDALSLAAHRGIVFHAPKELVIRARAGTPVAEIESALAAEGQHLIAEPPDMRALLGTSGEPTLGGAVATNLSGPRRVLGGAMRDHVLGLRFVTGTGQVFRAGGRVLKNVTGLDLCKLLTGSRGRLGAITEVTLKVLPAPERVGTVAIAGLGADAAVRAMAAALRSPFAVSAAAHIPPRADHPRGLTALRIEDFAASVTYRCDRLRAMLAEHGPAEIVADHDSRAFWRQVRDVAPLAGTGPSIWRVTLRPSSAASLAERITQAGGAWMMDGGGAVLFVAGEPGLAGVRQPDETWLTLNGEPIAIPEQPAMTRVRAVLDPGLIFAAS
jgi:glycolate oxidase FAD binding subunit